MKLKLHFTPRWGYLRDDIVKYRPYPYYMFLQDKKEFFKQQKELQDLLDDTIKEVINNEN